MTLSCPGCGEGSPEGSRFCNVCGEPLGPDTSTPTRAFSRFSGRGPAAPPGMSEARFLPGAILAGRYRIVGPVGRGGMGEVYRADDLKLGQAVALKFLPEDLKDDEERLQRLLTEVRLARQVSHPHVCRVYDVGEVDGHHYLSMEYVDGEDLASLLRRIGRLPRDKAVQLSRQICAGLAAAHDLGVLHRDLKPANIMIDGRGRARLTDFGLAALSESVGEEEVRYGTPAYMAPEQFEGKEVTERSDLFALGLVLYELFTGKLPYSADTLDEMKRARTETTPVSPSTLVDGFDPAVERVILRCLETQPVARPSSALAVAAALPGGDPLAAALAAGETPSPEMVAEADDPRRMRTGMACVSMASVLALLLAAFLLAPRVSLVEMATLDRPPQYLQERARDLLKELGYEEEPADSLYAFYPNSDYLRHLEDTWPGPGGWRVLQEDQPPAIRFHYRQSPDLLERISAASIGGWMTDPPMTTPGMAQVTLDTEGRLDSLWVVPPEHETGTGGVPDWNILLEAAGFDPGSLASVVPEWVPPQYADQRAAWAGFYPETPEIPLRLEAAGLGGKAVAFRIVRPWTRPAEAPSTQRGFLERVGDSISSLWFVFVLVAATIVAVRNLRAGRGDTRGAMRLALYLGFIRLFWILDAHLMPSSELVGILIGHLAYAMYRVGLVYVFYLAVEPYARRLWPQILVSWVRLLDGRFRDALVGRSLLLGSLGGVAMGMIPSLGGWIPELLGEVPLRPGWVVTMTGEALRGLRGSLVAVVATHTEEMFTIIFPITLLVILRLLFRRTWIAVAVISLLAVPMFYPGSGSVVGYLVGSLVTFVIYWMVFFRAGLLALTACATTAALVRTIPLTMDPSAWYAGSTFLVVVAILGPALYGMWSVLAARSAATVRTPEAPAAG